jgi:hypothetical protein
MHSLNYSPNEVHISPYIVPIYANLDRDMIPLFNVFKAPIQYIREYSSNISSQSRLQISQRFPKITYTNYCLDGTDIISNWFIRLYQEHKAKHGLPTNDELTIMIAFFNIEVEEWIQGKIFPGSISLSGRVTNLTTLPIVIKGTFQGLNKVDLSKLKGSPSLILHTGLLGEVINTNNRYGHISTMDNFDPIFCYMIPKDKISNIRRDLVEGRDPDYKTYGMELWIREGLDTKEFKYTSLRTMYRKHFKTYLNIPVVSKTDFGTFFNKFCEEPEFLGIKHRGLWLKSKAEEFLKESMPTEEEMIAIRQRANPVSVVADEDYEDENHDEYDDEFDDDN